MTIIVTIDDTIYEIDSKCLNSKQIEILAHILDVPTMAGQNT
jgi:hypothetical protein